MSAKLRRPKIICSSSHADFRSRANAAMVVGLGSHDKVRAHLGDIEIRQKTQNMKAFDVPTPEELI
jgi:hypothetical protein